MNSNFNVPSNGLVRLPVAHSPVCDQPLSLGSQTLDYRAGLEAMARFERFKSMVDLNTAAVNGVLRARVKVACDLMIAAERDISCYKAAVDWGKKAINCLHAEALSNARYEAALDGKKPNFDMLLDFYQSDLLTMDQALESKSVLMVKGLIYASLSQLEFDEKKSGLVACFSDIYSMDIKSKRTVFQNAQYLSHLKWSKGEYRDAAAVYVELLSQVPEKDQSLWLQPNK